MKSILIGAIATTIAMATGAHADPYDTYEITKQGNFVSIQRHRTDTGKTEAPKVYQYYRNAKGEPYDPVTGWPKGSKNGCVNGC